MKKTKKIPAAQMFDTRTITHSGKFKLGPKRFLSIGRSDFGWIFAGEWRGVKKVFPISNEAAELIFGAMLNYRNQSMPVQNVALLAHTISK